MTEYGTTTKQPRRAKGIPRTRGAITGLLLVLLGLWGALIPFVGPYFDYATTPDSTWEWTTGRFWLEVLPGGVAVIAGLLLLLAANRPAAVLGGWLASLAGAWFIVGPVLSRIWPDFLGETGAPVGDTTRQALVDLGFFYGLGALILFLGAQAAGRLSVKSVRDVRAAERSAETAPVTTHETQHRGGTEHSGTAHQRTEPGVSDSSAETQRINDPSGQGRTSGARVMGSQDGPPETRR
ncbi:hypothetical protein [Rhodococcus sp. X156]|uniref:hypothetical protein n=1 Tax=Rhodococcus sp. X156 TaxID=2499145 RepID=UPI000FD7460E|nr:hypothetical protein [Rhodococcus sp. X156]